MSATAEQAPLSQRSWYFVPRPLYTGGNRLRLLRGGAELFPAMVAALDAARHEVWLASYIFHHEAAALQISAALQRAARRGVAVRVVVDGFGSLRSIAALQPALQAAGVDLVVFRSLQRWTQWLQPGQLRRLHMKLCSIDGRTGFVGGINLIDDRFDLHHGRLDAARLDYAVQAEGPVVQALEQAVRAMWSRARSGRDWRQQVHELARTPRPLHQLRELWRELRLTRRDAQQAEHGAAPMRAAFLVRDNVRQRRSIERSYIDAIRQARQRIWLVTPYFYPGRAFRLALGAAARRGVDVRLLLQGRVDYRFAALAAQALYDELLRAGVQIHEYTPAFLHAKVALVDQDWATVGSSNIDPISLLLNLEANLLVRDAGFNATLAEELAGALQRSRRIEAPQGRSTGLRGWLRRTLVAWCARLYLRLAGVSGRY